MNQTPSSERLHIAIFGRRNAGKSSLINALTRQEAAIVSAVPGTTTDPVRKSMEILPIGPVVIVDTAGIDDVGELGEKRIRMTMRILDQTNLALLVLDQEQGIDGYEEELLDHFRKRETDVIAVANKIDSKPDYSRAKEWAKSRGVPFAAVSAMTGEGIEDLKRLMADVAPENFFQPAIIGDLLNPGDIAILVIPVDKAAPKGRLILPQVMTLRDAIDHDAYAMVVKERELRDAIASLNKKPKIVVTDSQAVLKASADTPRDIPFTTFSILFARYKGDLEILAKGAKALRDIKPGAKVLIAEAARIIPCPTTLGRCRSRAGCGSTRAARSSSTMSRGGISPRTWRSMTSWSIAGGACSTARRCWRAWDGPETWGSRSSTTACSCASYMGYLKGPWSRSLWRGLRSRKTDRDTALTLISLPAAAAWRDIVVLGGNPGCVSATRGEHDAMALSGGCTRGIGGPGRAPERGLRTGDRGVVHWSHLV